MYDIGGCYKARKSRKEKKIVKNQKQTKQNKKISDLLVGRKA